MQRTTITCDGCCEEGLSACKPATKIRQWLRENGGWRTGIRVKGEPGRQDLCPKCVKRYFPKEEHHDPCGT